MKMPKAIKARLMPIAIGGKRPSATRIGIRNRIEVNSQTPSVSFTAWRNTSGWRMRSASMRKSCSGASERKSSLFPPRARRFSSHRSRASQTDCRPDGGLARPGGRPRDVEAPRGRAGSARFLAPGRLRHGHGLVDDQLPGRAAALPDAHVMAADGGAVLLPERVAEGGREVTGARHAAAAMPGGDPLRPGGGGGFE